MKIRIGPSGLGPIKEAISNLEHYHKLGLTACEIAFTYGAYIKNKSDAEEIGERAKQLNISLSIHAPYWINLNSDDASKIKKSKERILESCKVGTWLGAKTVVFHPGFYGKRPREEAYKNIKKHIMEIQASAKKMKYTPRIAPEMMGKINVFGSVSEIYNLVSETGCGFCIDFAHILARDKKYRFKEVLKMFKKFAPLHIHFSGIEYNEKGERRHIKTPIKDFKELLKSIPKNTETVIINESPQQIKDAVEGIKILKSL